MKKYFLSLLVLLAAMSCKVKKETQATNGNSMENQSVVCPTDVLNWKVYGAAKPQPKFVNKYLPTQYQIYQLNREDLQTVMNKIKTQKLTVLNLPVYGECISFELKPSKVMSPELAAKFPELQSYRGFAQQDKAVTASIDYDGKVIRIAVETMKGSFILEPFESDLGTFYLAFDKNNSGIPKVPIEQPKKK